MPSQEQDGAISLESARTSLDVISRQLATSDVSNAELASARRKLSQLLTYADATASKLSEQLAGVGERLKQLGSPTTSGGPEAADLVAQRQLLEEESRRLDAQIRLARLISVESEQLLDRLGVTQRRRFQEQLFQRSSSLLSADLWEDLAWNARRDLSRLGQELDEFRRLTVQASLGAWLHAFAVFAFASVLRIWIGRYLDDLVKHQVPQSRLRRSTYAVLRALLATWLPTTALYAFAQHALAGGSRWQELFTEAIGAVFFAAYVAGLGNALLLVGRPSWRLARIPDGVAAALRHYPMLLGAAMFIGWLSLRLNAFIQGSLETTIAIEGFMTLVLGLLLARSVSKADRMRRAELLEQGRSAVRRPWWLVTLVVSMWVLMAFSVVSVVVGYVSLGSFLVRQSLWVLTVVLSAWFLLAVIGDGTGALLASQVTNSAASTESAAKGARAQIALLASGVLKLAVLLLAVTLILAPFGSGPTELLDRTSRLRAGLKVGELQLRPLAVLQAAMVFALAVVALRALQTWLSNTFLPATSLDLGMRSSLVTLVGFVGGITTVALALSAIGLELDKVTWIASALTVGIGFGMQAVISNFVSGLILLAERPVKVGDWVALGAVEGDIRRINVRATEIQMTDQSTVIVPNSEFITKVIRNVTHQNPLGLVSIRLPLPLDTDPERVRDVILGVLQAHDDIVDAPPPSVLLEGIDAGSLIFNVSGFVSSPRKVFEVRSAVLFRILTQLRRAELR